ncbi:MAG: 50S ribosomal protein L4 [Oscillospiraceae bacterium]|mgnify:CR=1 FL=1|jgi:large subunit ribosomal protein L4|nr:50S ribosomal protein L4 [Oscillospiraceae bacterium]
MAKFDVLDINGAKVDTVELSDAVFGITPNEKVMHMAVVNFLANQRQGTQSTLTRAEVRGGGRKPWRQKGTGRARQGSIRAPQWTHGGVALGPKPRDYSYSLNKKVKRLAICSALSAKAAEGKLVIVNDFAINEFSTKAVVKMLGNLNVTGKTLMVQAVADKKVVKSAGNIPGVQTTVATTMNVYDTINAKTLVVDLAAAKKLEEVFA